VAPAVVFRWETGLTPADHEALAGLLRATFGGAYPGVFDTRSWARARKEARLWLADGDGRPLAHLAAERRLVAVGDAEVLVAGVGEVAVDPERHGRGLGRALLAEFDRRLSAELAADFGFLQTERGAAGFYRSCGWTTVPNRVRAVDYHDEVSVVGGPVSPDQNPDEGESALVRPARLGLDQWPDGLVDLRGVSW
jgi:GNAT superfamily N-acetyltransferase